MQNHEIEGDGERTRTGGWSLVMPHHKLGTHMLSGFGYIYPPSSKSTANVCVPGPHAFLQ